MQAGACAAEKRRMIRRIIFFGASLAVLVPAAALPACAGSRSVLRKPGAAYRRVAVTFDDLPAPSDGVVSYSPAALRAMTARLLGALERNRIPAIGFVNEEKLHRGEFSARVQLLKMWLDAGFSLGNHTYSHVDIDTTPLPAYEADFLRGEQVTQALLRARGLREKYFRYPFLDVGKTPATKRAFEKFLAAHGYHVAPVTIDNEEYMFAAVYAHAVSTGDTVLAERVVRSFLKYMNDVFAYFESASRELLGYEPAQVLLLHADLLDTDEMNALARLMRARAYHFVSLDAALRDPAYRQPDNYVDGGGVSWIEHWADTQHKSLPSGPDVPKYIQEIYTKDSL